MSTLPPVISPPPLPEDEPAGNILLVENAISLEQCQAICEYIESEHAKNPGVSNPQRTAFLAPINEPVKSQLHAILYRLFCDQIEPFFDKVVEWWEMPQLLRYEQGGQYRAHSDSENPSKDPANPGWTKVHDRDLSFLLYLNDDFTGGLLDFPDHQRKIIPKPGLMVAFPSDHHYRHAAEPTQSGVRYVMACWATVKGSARIKPQAPANCTFMDSYTA